MQSLVEDVLNAVNRDITNLGHAAPPEMIEKIVVRHAKLGAGSNQALQQEAADLARERLQNGASPTDAATFAATQTYAKSVSQRPSLGNHGAELLGYRPAGATGIPGSNEVNAYLANHDDANMTSAQRGVLSSATESYGHANVSPELAAQAQAAIINAASDGVLMPAGIDISGDLTVVVHNDVTLELKNSQIKTTKGEVVYNHVAGNFHLVADDVRLTANAVNINASVTETNIVRNRKYSLRKEYSKTWGSKTVTTNPLWDLTITGLGSDINGLSNSFGAVRVGAAVRMDTWGAGRIGFKGVSHATVRTTWMEKANGRLIKSAAIMIIL